MTVGVERIARRRRRTIPHHYLGALTASADQVRLSGRDPAMGIEVSLSIPLSEIRSVRTSASASENVRGAGAVVLELAGSEAMCLREVGGGSPDSLARTLAALVRSHRPAERAAVAT